MNNSQKTFEKIRDNLENSTWAMQFPDAYKELLEYSDDITDDIRKEFTKSIFDTLMSAKFERFYTDEFVPYVQDCGDDYQIKARIAKVFGLTD